MKKKLVLSLMLLVSSVTFASTEHYLLRETNHVYHLKITKLAADDIKVSADVDFEPTEKESGKHACTASVAGEAKSAGENVLVLKKHLDGEAEPCAISIQLSPNGAKLEQSKGCDNFAAGLCHFNTEGKELLKVK